MKIMRFLTIFVLGLMLSGNSVHFVEINESNYKASHTEVYKSSKVTILEHRTVTCKKKSKCTVPTDKVSSYSTTGYSSRTYWDCGPVVESVIGDNKGGYYMSCVLNKYESFLKSMEISDDCADDVDDCMTEEEFEETIGEDGEVIEGTTSELNCKEPPCTPEPIIPSINNKCPSIYVWGDGYCKSELEVYGDDLNWNCVVTDDSKREEELGDGSVDSYCPVYCREDFLAETEQDPVEVEAGKHFVWPNSDRGLYGSRQCKTKDVYWSKFLTDLYAANDAVDDAFKEWRFSVLLADKAESTVYKRSEEKNCDPVYKSYSCPTEENPDKTCCCKFSHYKHYTYYYEPGTVTYLGETRWVSEDKEICNGQNEIQEYRESVIKGYKDQQACLKAAYEASKLVPIQIYNKMLTCYTNWSEEEVYTTNPTMSITYIGENGNTYSYLDDMSVEIEYSEMELDRDCTPVTVYVQYLQDVDSSFTDDSYNGNARPSGNSNSLIRGQRLNIYRCKKIEASRSAGIYYSLKDELYRYVDKETGISFHYDQLNQFLSEQFKNYYDIGYGNFPVNYKTIPMTYGYSTGVGQLSIHFDHYGHLEGGSGGIAEYSRIEILIDGEAAAKGHSNYRDMLCEYTVTKGIAQSEDPTCTDPPCQPDSTTNPDLVTNKCTTKECTKEELEEIYGKKVIYRPIDLTDPFPSIEGDGRKTGANWCSGTNCKNTNSVVDSVILNNRKVTGDAVYNLEPMYSFTLTPSIINQIREYNQTRVYDDVDMSCDKNNKGNNVLGKHCISEYLTDLIELTNATGTCTQDRRTNFDSCRY